MNKYLLIASLLGLATLQCSSSENPPPKFPDAAAFCAGWAEAECSAAIVQNCAITKAACLSMREAKCTAQRVNPMLALGYTYDFRQAEACINNVALYFSDNQLTNAEYTGIAKICGLVFSGPGTRGMPCTVDADCKQGDGLRCVVHALPGSAAAAGAATSASGTCQIPTTLASGGLSCSAQDAVCPTGFHCGTSLHCDADGAAAERCDPVIATCATGFKCSDASVCVAQAAEGIACVTDSDCASGMCLRFASGDRCGQVYTISGDSPFCTGQGAL